MELQHVVQAQRDFFSLNTTKNIKFRLEKLKLLKSNILKFQDEICEALKADLGKSSTESYMAEIGMVITELNYIIKHLKGWAKPTTVKGTYVKNVSVTTTMGPGIKIDINSFDK